MKVSLNWLKEYVDVTVDSEQLKMLFTEHSQEVDNIQPLVQVRDLVVGHVVHCEPHPDADKLSVCTVDVGTKITQIVCGAANVGANQKVIVALPGALLDKGLVIKESIIRGVESNGMICSLSELGIAQKYHGETGIHVLNDDAEVGSDAIKALAFDDAVMTLDLTPNRADLLSMHGVSYDVSAILNKPLTIPTPNVSFSDKQNPMVIQTQTESCMSYYGAVIDDLVIKDSPVWMKARLIAAGIRPINNVVDITNYVLIETGQPLHAFDFDALNSETIVVRNAVKNETFVTLDDKERILESHDIVITDGKNAVALGGVMGGAATEVTSKTQSILLESATFEPKSIRKTSRRLDLRSESSLRFERGVDPQKTKVALMRACELFVAYAHATVREGIQFFDNNDNKEQHIIISLETINGVLGTTLNNQSISDVLTRLRFDFKTTSEGFDIQVPSRRQDLKTYQDIIEEIARMIGYNQIPDTLPLNETIGRLSEYQTFKRRIKNTLVGLGLSETINYALVDLERNNDFTNKPTNNMVFLSNPLSEQHQVLTLSPLNGLLNVLSYHHARKMNDVHVFELGKRYTTHKETEMLGLALMGHYQQRAWKTLEAVDFYTVKGIVEALFKRLNIDHVTFEKAELESYHPHQTAIVYVQGQKVGHIAKVHPSKTRQYDLEDVFVCELNIEKLFKYRHQKVVYKPVQRYPQMIRDIALKLNTDIASKHVIDAIYELSFKPLKEAYVFDVYQGEHLENNKKSLAIRLVFEDPTQTLEAEAIDKHMQSVVQTLTNTFDAELR